MGDLYRYYRWQPDAEHADGGRWTAATNGDRPVVCEADEVPIGAPRRKWDGSRDAIDLFGVAVPASQ